LCGRAPAGEHALPRSTGIEGPESVVEFVNIHDASGKPDGKAIRQARGHIMRRIHQARRKSQEKPLEMSQNNQKVLQPSRSRRTCPDQEMWEDVRLRRPSVRTVLGSGRSDPFVALSMPNVSKRYHELVDYCKQNSHYSSFPPQRSAHPIQLPDGEMPAYEFASDVRIVALASCGRKIPSCVRSD
jgi:hypothetical protein